MAVGSVLLWGVMLRFPLFVLCLASPSPSPPSPSYFSQSVPHIPSHAPSHSFLPLLSLLCCPFLPLPPFFSSLPPFPLHPLLPCPFPSYSYPEGPGAWGGDEMLPVLQRRWRCLRLHIALVTCSSSCMHQSPVFLPHPHPSSLKRYKGKGSPYSTAERRVPELIPDLGS